MEHRVKQRSAEWFKLRQNVSLTASTFADAVGIGKGKPFHFFQSQVEKNVDEADDDSISSSQRQVLQHGVRMEAVIREAYELLTGLRVQESGFWVPKEDDTMHGLIGASPDGVVVNSNDTSRVVGLVEFKAPVYKLYGRGDGALGDIPRQYMVQIQGQMAVCGAPWCDFMAVCSKTKEIMLKRVFFQPRYWQHIANRLKQFCFALEEAAIMKDIGRDVYSGAMTKRLQQQSMQDKPLPAEDIITVENLLSRPVAGMFRGPSKKLLSYDILVGDSYVLPATLSRYGQDLLAKVDAECRSSKAGKTNSAIIEETEIGSVCHREFCEMDVRSPESPDRVFGEGASIFDTETTQQLESSVAETQLTGSECRNSAVTAVSRNSSGMPGGVVVRGGNTGVRTAAPRGANSTPPGRLTTAGLVKKNMPKVGAGAASAPTQPASKPRTESPPFRKLSRITTGSRENTPRTVSSSAPRSAAAGYSPRGVLPRSSPRAISPRIPVPGNLQRGSVARRSPRAPASPFRPSVPNAAATTSSVISTAQQPSVTAVTTSVSGTVTHCMSVPTTVTTAAPVTATAPLQSSQTTTTPAWKARPVRSARDEWEISAKAKQPPNKRPLGQGASDAKTVSATVDDASKSASAPATAMNLALDLSRRSGAGDPGNARGSGDQQMQWSTKVHDSSSSFVPPGLTLLSSSETAAGQSSSKNSEDTTKDAAVMQESELQSETQIPVLGRQKEETSKPATSQQAQKRPHKSQSPTPDTAEFKKPLLDTLSNRGDGAAEQNSSSGDRRELRTSPERNPIHRPWQALGEDRDHHQSMAREPERAGGFRDLASFDRTHDKLSHSFDSREEGQRSRGRPDRAEMGRERTHESGHQRGHLFDERGGSRVSSLMDQERVSAQTRIFDYDHQDRIMSEDLYQRRNVPHRGIPISTTMHFDSMRRLPLDLSEQRRLQELAEREASRGRALGRESGVGLDVEAGVWRDQLQRQLLQQQSLRQLRFRSELQAGLRNSLGGNWLRGQALQADMHRSREHQPHLLDRHFPGPEARDGRLGGAGVNFRRDPSQEQFPRGFPPGRRPHNF